jgi:hypothetical protein
MFHKQQGGKVDAKRCGYLRISPIYWRAEFHDASGAESGLAELDLPDTRVRRSSGRFRFDQSQPETLVVIATGKSATADQAGDGSTNPAHAREFPLAIAAPIKITANEFACGHRQLVTGAFPGDVEIAAGPAPFPAVRKNAPTAGSMLGQQMSQLVTQSSLDLFGAESLQYGIKSNEGMVRFSPANRRPHAPVPFDT